MIILGLAELFKAMNQPNSIRPGRTMMLFDGLFLVKYQRYRHENMTQSWFKSSIYAINI